MVVISNISKNTAIRIIFVVILFHEGNENDTYRALSVLLIE